MYHNSVCVCGGGGHILLTEASRKSFSGNKYKYIWDILQPGELFLLLFYTNFSLQVWKNLL